MCSIAYKNLSAQPFFMFWDSLEQYQSHKTFQTACVEAISFSKSQSNRKWEVKNYCFYVSTS